MNKYLLCLLCLTAAIPVLAEKTRSRRQSEFSDFEKGTADKVEIHSDGRLTLAPKLQTIYEAPTSYLWDLAVDREGNVFAAAGPEAKVFRIGADGRKTVFFETDAVEIHALAVDDAGNVYAATSPEAKIYKIDPSGGYALYYDPHATYVWDLALGPDGALYVATGDEGEIHRVSPSGQGELLFETGETHVRSLAFDRDGALIAGTDPGGLVLRLSETAGETGESVRAFVLYQSPKKEMTAIAVGDDGVIYAAGAGVRTATLPTVSRTTVRPTTAGRPATSAAGSTGARTAAQPALRPPPAPSTVALQIRGGSAIVRLAPDGEPQQIWSHSQDVVYSLGFDAEGRLLAGTGERGRLIRIESEHVAAIVMSLPSNQITAITNAADGRTLLGVSNIGQVLALGPGSEEEGTFVSDVLDAKVFARFGRVEFSGAGTVEVAARSGNQNRPPNNWSEWSPAVTDPGGADAEIPAARYAQWRATLREGSDAAPAVDSVTHYYRPRNAAPRITTLEVTPANHRFPAKRVSSTTRTLALRSLGSRTVRRPTTSQIALQTMIADSGYQGVRWLAQDSNGDSLRATVEIRGEGESTWMTLEKDLEDARFSFDSTAFADGRYRLRVTVSDAEANPVDDSRSASRTSEPFLIDNQQPRLEGLTATRENGGLRIRFTASDETSKIASAEYSIDGAEWRAAAPVSGLFDSRRAELDFVAPAESEGEHTVAVRAADERGNQAAAKVVVR